MQLQLELAAEEERCHQLQLQCGRNIQTGQKTQLQLGISAVPLQPSPAQPSPARPSPAQRDLDNVTSSGDTENKRRRGHGRRVLSIHQNIIKYSGVLLFRYLRCCSAAVLHSCSVVSVQDSPLSARARVVRAARLRAPVSRLTAHGTLQVIHFQ